MKLLIVLFIIMSPLTFGIELILNGKSYNIDEFKVEKNGQRLVINHKSIETSPKVITKTITTQARCVPGIPFKRAREITASLPRIDRNKKIKKFPKINRYHVHSNQERKNRVRKFPKIKERPKKYVSSAKEEMLKKKLLKYRKFLKENAKKEKEEAAKKEGNHEEVFH